MGKIIINKICKSGGEGSLVDNVYPMFTPKLKTPRKSLIYKALVV